MSGLTNADREALHRALTETDDFGVAKADTVLVVNATVEAIVARHVTAALIEVADAIEAVRRDRVRVSIPASKRTPREAATNDALTTALGIVRAGIADNTT